MLPFINYLLDRKFVENGKKPRNLKNQPYRDIFQLGLNTLTFMSYSIISFKDIGGVNTL